MGIKRINSHESQVNNLNSTSDSVRKATKNYIEDHKDSSLTQDSDFDPYEGIDNDLLGFDPKAIFEGVDIIQSNFTTY